MPSEGRGHSPGAGNTGLKSAIEIEDALKHKVVKDKLGAAIEKLRAQNEELKHDLLLENKFSVRPGDPYAQALINRLQDEGDMLARKLVLEMRKTKLLDLHLQETNSVLGTTRSLMGGIFASRDKVQAVANQIKLLENRLEKAYIKYNQSVTHTKQLRDQINNLRKERIMFQDIDRNLDKELTKLKKEMGETIQLANVAFEAKEKAIAEMNVLKVQAEKEQQGFEEEWKQLAAIIEEDKRERERIRAKEMAMRERETQELLKMGAGGGTEKKPTTSTKSFSRTMKMLGKTMSLGRGMEQSIAAEKVQMYTQAFEKIQQATGIEDIDQLVHTFITAEDQNYTLFNYVNDVNGEIEKLEDQITAIKLETEKYKLSGQEFDKGKGSHFAAAEESLLSAEALDELYRKRYAAAVSTVGLLKTSIGDIFTKIGCDTPSVREILGDEGVTESNIMSYLGIIEQRTNELLQMNALRKGGQGRELAIEALIAQPLTQLSSRIVIEPPSATHEEEIEGMEVDIIDDDKPLSRDLLEARVNKTLPFKLENAIKVRPPGTEATTKKTHTRR